MNCPPYEGAFAQPNPQYQLSNPPYAMANLGAVQPVAAPGGVIQGRFGWADPATGYVGNSLVVNGPLGIVVPLVGWRATWGRVFFDPTVCAVRQRQFLPATLGVGGPYWVRFEGGAFGGQPVYADHVDGHAISGQTVGASLTPWTVVTNCCPGGLAVINTHVKFGA